MKIIKASFLPMLLTVLVTVFFACDSRNTNNQTSQNKDSLTNAVKLQLVTTDIERPVFMKVAPDNSHRIFIGDLGGKIWIMEDGRVLPKPFIDISSKLENKDSAMEIRAIYGLAFHPQFEKNKKFYISYNAPSLNTQHKCEIAVSEFQASNENADSAILSSERRVFSLDDKNVGGNNSEIEFGPDGYLYISIGDHGETEQKQYENEYAQKLNSLLGKMLRIDVDKTPYAIPLDNPFVNNKEARPEIWATGLRRFWRFSFDPNTKQMMGGDVGDHMQEEIDIIEKGGNYGWPVKEGDSMYLKDSKTDTSKFAAPINTYAHKDGICVIGGYVYQGNQISFLDKKYVFADFNGNLFSLEKNKEGGWIRQPLKVVNMPKDPLLIFSCGVDDKNELYLLGALNPKPGLKGVIYKLVKG